MSINSDRIAILAQKTVSIHANFFNNLNETFVVLIKVGKNSRWLGEICAILTTFENDTLVPVLTILNFFKTPKSFSFLKTIGKRPMMIFGGGKLDHCSKVQN